MAARTNKLLISAILLSTILAGCGGGGGGPSFTPIDPGLFTPNYVTSLNTGLFHWNHLPVKIRFVRPSDWNTLYALNPDLDVDAASEWNKPGQQALTAVVSSGADVMVTFVPQSTFGSPTTQGATSYHYYTGSNEMKDASIQVALDIHGGGTLPANDAQAIIAHEIGHALGIGGHSTVSTDLMYPVHTLGSTHLAGTRDLNTAMTAYPSYFTTGALQPFHTQPRGELRHAVIE